MKHHCSILILAIFLAGSCEPSPESGMELFEGPVSQLQPLGINTLLHKYSILFAGGTNGIFRMGNTGWIRINGSEGIQVVTLDLCIDGSDTLLWFATESSLYKFSLKQGVSLPLEAVPGEVTGHIPGKIRAIQCDPGGALWLVCGEGVFMHCRGQWYFEDKNSMPAEIPDQAFTSLGITGNGKVYAGTEIAGASVFLQDIDGISGASPYDHSTGIPGGRINDILIDHDDNQWFATSTGLGLHFGEYLEVNWNVFTINDGLCDNDILAICMDDSGMIYTVSSNGIGIRLDAGWKCVEFPAGFFPGKINDLTISNNKLWLAASKGLYFAHVDKIK